MDRAPMQDSSVDAHARDRCIERARALATVKFMGLSELAQIEAPLSFLAKVRLLLLRA